MGSVNGTLGFRHLEYDVLKLFGFIATDASGNPTNAAGVKDQDGDALPIPKEIVSVTQVQTGVYRFLLKQDWFKLLTWNMQAYVPEEQAQATLIGSVDLNGLTLSTLNGLTAKFNATAGGLVTTTFVTPASIQAIADQINTAEVTATKNARAYIVTNADGSKRLKVVDQTFGTTSSLTADATSTGTTALGITTGTTPVGQSIGNFVLGGFNPKGKVVNSVNATGTFGRPAQSYDFIYENGAGAASILKSGGIHFELTLKVANFV